MRKVVDAVVDGNWAVDNLDRPGIAARFKAARERLGLSQKALAVAVGVSWRAIQENEGKNDRVPGGKILSGLMALGINTQWLLTGEGDMLLQGAPGPADQGAAVYNRESVAAQGQAQYQIAPEPLISGIDGALLRQCWGACAAVHGEPFAASSPFLQLEHAVELYNLLQRLAAAGARAALEDFARLDIGDLAQQLRIFIKMGRARPFSADPPSP